MNSRIIKLFLPVILIISTVLSVVAQEGTILSGVVKDRNSKKKLENVSVSLSGTNIAVVTNAEGSFTLKIPDGVNDVELQAEQIGYHSATVKGVDLISNPENITIWLIPNTKLLDEITVRGGDPRIIVEEALNKISTNYPDSSSLYSAFYRETIQKGRRYIGVSEAMVDVLKKPYGPYRTTVGDKVQLRKGRRLISQNAKDTVAVKIVGGPTMPVVLDFVKNEDVLFAVNELDDYEFKMQDPVLLDDRLQYVISFKPVVIRDYAMMEGVLFIDQETLSFTSAKFNLDMRDKVKATDMILVKKPRGLHFTPQEMSFTVNYKYQNGKSYLNYISTKTRFKCDWKRRLFSSGYTTLVELVMVDREDNPSEGITRKNAFGRRDVFYDMVENYWDPDFWKDYNIIEPTESLEKAVRKLRK